MPRRKRTRGTGKKSKKKTDHIFNPALKGLDVMIGPSQEQVREKDTRQIGPGRSATDDEKFFLQAMSDVIPLKEKDKKAVRIPGANIRPIHPAPDDEKEAMDQLHGLVRGSVEMDISFSDEYIEGSVQGFNRKLMKKLKKGQFPVQDYIDLHGLTRQEAETKVREFLIRSHRLGLRCVLIVHGRGLNSPDSFPVIKERLPLWFNRGPVKRIVLAFVTARPYDGGTGAIYVLLRKR